MPSFADSTPASPWNEGDSFRETTLVYIDPEHREALRQVGHLIYDLAVETTSFPGDESITRAELRAALAELRYLEGFFDMMRRSANQSSLAPSDDRLAYFAGRLGRKVGALAGSIEGRLS